MLCKIVAAAFVFIGCVLLLLFLLYFSATMVHVSRWVNNVALLHHGGRRGGQTAKEKRAWLHSAQRRCIKTSHVDSFVGAFAAGCT